MQYCLSTNEDMRCNTFRCSGTPYFPIKVHPSSFSQKPRLFKRIPYLVDGLEVMRQKCFHTFIDWYRRKVMVGPHEIIVGANQKLFIRIEQQK